MRNHHQRASLKQCLNAFELTCLGIGAIIGAGVVVLTGIAAATKTGPAIVVSFIVAGLCCAFSALSYAELAASIGGCGSAYLFFAYIGFDAVSTAAEEVINPQRNLPIGIITSLVICTLLYIVVSALLTGIVPYQYLNVASPISEALMRLEIKFAGALIAV